MKRRFNELAGLKEDETAVRLYAKDPDLYRRYAKAAYGEAPGYWEWVDRRRMWLG